MQITVTTVTIIELLNVSFLGFYNFREGFCIVSPHLHMLT